MTCTIQLTDLQLWTVMAALRVSPEHYKLYSEVSVDASVVDLATRYAYQILQARAALGLDMTDFAATLHYRDDVPMAAQATARGSGEPPNPSP